MMAAMIQWFWTAFENSNIYSIKSIYYEDSGQLLHRTVQHTTRQPTRNDESGSMIIDFAEFQFLGGWPQCVNRIWPCLWHYQVSEDRVGRLGPTAASAASAGFPRGVLRLSCQPG